MYCKTPLLEELVIDPGGVKIKLPFEMRIANLNKMFEDNLLVYRIISL